MLNGDPTQRPAALTLEGMHRRGVPSSVAFMIEHLMTHRVVHWTDESVAPEDAQRLNDLWIELQTVKEGEDLVAWGAQFRCFLWGSIEPWTAFAEKNGLAEQRDRWERAKHLVGISVLRALKDHEYWRKTWGAAAATDYPRMAREQQDRRSSRQSLRAQWEPVQSLPPESLSWPMVVERTHALQNRFGFTQVTASGDLNLEDVWHHVQFAETGLSLLAQALEWNDHDIGGARLGLTFELNEHATAAAAYYDPSSASINIGMQGWGSFAHEWGHALDQALGATWLPNANGKNRYASEQAHNVYAQHPDEFQHDRAIVRERTALPDQTAQRIDIARRTVLQLPNTLMDLAAQAHSPVLRSLGEEQVEGLRAWQARALDPSTPPDTVKADWRRWKMKALAWSARANGQPSVDQALTQAWLVEWNWAVSAVEIVAFDTLPVAWSWQALGRARDQLENRTYWSEPHEEWARSFHAYVRQTIGKNSWAADRADRPDHFPQGPELEREAQWWRTQLPRWRETWSLSITPQRPRPSPSPNV